MYKDSSKDLMLRPLMATWWRSIDSWIFFPIALLIVMGIWLIVAASPSVSLQHGWSTFILLKKHLIILVPSFLILLSGSLFSRTTHIYIAKAILIFATLGVCATLWMGAEIKGARRWLALGSFSLQPSEFLKPALCIVMANLFARYSKEDFLRGFIISGMLLFCIILPLFLQPDLGMIFVLCALWFIQSIIAGLEVRLILGFMLTGILGAVGIYFCFPHAALRITAFLSPIEKSDAFGSQYQISQALKGFASGGLWGKGPGAGTVLDKLPDSHADFIFAVAGEELGLFACLFILSLYGCIIFKSLWIALSEEDLFYKLSITGLSTQLALQLILNVGSVLKLMPTKGVTLPFISYGGSSLLSLCWASSMLLVFTRKYKLS